jgi:two-component system, chemotaxis family, sensor kinase CheA
VNDPELARLLREEFVRHLGILASDADAESARRSLHALKGSAGLAGEMDFAARIARLERRLRDGDETARGTAVELLQRALGRMERGVSPNDTEWPTPPPDMLPGTIDPLVRAQYVAEIKDRLYAIDQACALADAIEGARTIFRHIHTIKGAAGAVGDEPMAWFCHGLEERLTQASQSEDKAQAAVANVIEHRATLGWLLEDAGRALDVLRGDGNKEPRVLQRPSSHRPSQRPHDDELHDATIRVAAASVDTLFDRILDVERAEEVLHARAERSRVKARQLRRLRAELADALRLIGPPRPWGAPAAAIRKIEQSAQFLESMAEKLDHAGVQMTDANLALREATDHAKRELRAMRQTPVRGLFARLTASIEAESRRLGKKVLVQWKGADEPIDRRTAEALSEPLLQLVRNAVAHGIEAPAERLAVRKDETATIALSAERRGTRLVLGISDDGAGVDLGRVRERAAETGVATPAFLRDADDDMVLSLLFSPGFSMRSEADLLAGRGVGLDIALLSVERLGGTIRLSSIRGQGLRARIEVPLDAGLAHVLWVQAGSSDYAIEASRAHALRKLEAGDVVPTLASCLEGGPVSNPQGMQGGGAVAVEFDGAGDERLVVAVDSVGPAQELLVRPVSPLVSRFGPYSGVVVRTDGTPHLLVDLARLSPRLRAIALARA